VGCTSSFLRWRSDRGLSPLGREFVEYLNNQNILVDLAHASKRTFWDAVAVHCRCAPLLVSHTGIDSAHRHWRNLNDDQLRAVADSGGVVGIFFHGPFLGSGPFGGRVWRVAKHIAAAVRLIGADHVALGSDWDGMTPTPLDMRTCLELPKLVQAMLDEKLSDEQIHSVLGGSFNRLLRMIRP
jgi:membrane dipeptidase